MTVHGPWMNIGLDPQDLLKLRSVDGKKPRGVEVHYNRVRVLFRVSEEREPRPFTCYAPLPEYCWDGTP